MSEQASVNPWIVQPVKAKFEPLPVDYYLGSFKVVEAATVKRTQADDTGERWRFKWEVQAGAHKGKMADALCDRKINAGSHSGRLISGMLGRALVDGEDVKAAIEACIGKTYMVQVAPGPKGGKPCVRSCGTPPAM